MNILSLESNNYLFFQPKILGSSVGEFDMEGFCEKLNEYLQTEFEYKRKHAYTSPVSSTLVAHTKMFDLYFRWLPISQSWKNNTLVIARIGFKNTRIGHGTRLLQFLCKQARKFGVEYIGIESANSNSVEFGRKLGFELVSERNWHLSVFALSENIKSRLAESKV